ncbi:MULTISPECIES: glycerol dehydratase reactivase beta/small subunit family protein [Enterococcus]|uniref:Propanediol dehydratase n=1 Tax=Candidatus Enterococcus mangumiae TaxID=2230878 RepID=A0ABZ2SZS6_9ENTE|nr:MULTISPECIES: glycerol dehydratase reactivase beta/small subunit family protein [unclassified Enterococcus]MBO0462012.1 glycerol dehydratase reactivase beta/small subunit family protein [Enterococcus sp. DIV1298c]MBO0491072.1 glycerol dehydratase reactivase beta/small subunit family protein [Enterococcus sp. DIV1094]MBO1299231.1 glycerol dehydratase reactivase beta/small subunit family protein [Enterococcus sp. DIV1271a]
MDRPSIIIYVDGIDEAILTSLLYGIEEESIPYKLEAKAFNNAAQAAYEAALASPLQVGIGGSKDTLCLHHKSLKREAPYQVLQHVSIVPSTILRNLGSNAARIVKSIPLKSLELLEVNQ